MDFEIRPMLACDTAGVENIEKECFSSPWKYDDLLYHAGNRDSHFLVAVKGEEIAGYIFQKTGTRESASEFCG